MLSLAPPPRKGKDIYGTGGGLVYDPGLVSELFSKATKTNLGMGAFLDINKQILEEVGESFECRTCYKRSAGLMSYSL